MTENIVWQKTINSPLFDGPQTYQIPVTVVDGIVQVSLPVFAAMMQELGWSVVDE